MPMQAEVWECVLRSLQPSLSCRVICMSCGDITHRDSLQARLEALNPESAAAIKRVVAAQVAARRGALHPSTADEALQAEKVSWGPCCREAPDFDTWVSFCVGFCLAGACCGRA